MSPATRHTGSRSLLHGEVEERGLQVELGVAIATFGGRDTEGLLVKGDRGLDVGDVERDVGLEDVEVSSLFLLDLSNIRARSTASQGHQQHDEEPFPRLQQSSQT